MLFGSWFLIDLATLQLYEECISCSSRVLIHVLVRTVLKEEAENYMICLFYQQISVSRMLKHEILIKV